MVVQSHFAHFNVITEKLLNILGLVQYKTFLRLASFFYGSCVGVLKANVAFVSDFYLTSPPPGAPHKPISPSKLVFAGDSAGAGLCVVVLTILRDLGLPQPAGAVLISPWVDLTHSFPSVMKNTNTVSQLSCCKLPLIMASRISSPRTVLSINHRHSGP